MNKNIKTKSDIKNKKKELAHLQLSVKNNYKRNTNLAL